MVPEGIGMSDHGKHGNALRATRKEAWKKSALYVPATSHHAMDSQGLVCIIVPHHNLIRLLNDALIIFILKNTDIYAFVTLMSLRTEILRSEISFHHVQNLHVGRMRISLRNAPQ